MLAYDLPAWRVASDMPEAARQKLAADGADAAQIFLAAGLRTHPQSVELMIELANIELRARRDRGRRHCGSGARPDSPGRLTSRPGFMPSCCANKAGRTKRWRGCGRYCPACRRTILQPPVGWWNSASRRLKRSWPESNTGTCQLRSPGAIGSKPRAPKPFRPRSSRWRSARRWRSATTRRITDGRRSASRFRCWCRSEPISPTTISILCRARTRLSGWARAGRWPRA